jgi:hypothetical protein
MDAKRAGREDRCGSLVRKRPRLAAPFLAADRGFIDGTENGTHDICQIDEDKGCPRLWREQQEAES